MASRDKRKASTARPGDIVNKAKQKRRTAEEIAQDNLDKAELKAAQAKAALEAHQAGVQRVARKESALRAEDELARENSARPDLVTAEVKRKAVEKQKKTDVSMDPDSSGEDDEDGSFQPDDDADADDNSSSSDDEGAMKEFLKQRAAQKKSKKNKAAKLALRTEINDAAEVNESEKSLKRKPSGPSAETEPKKTKIAAAAVGGLKKGWKKAVEVVTQPSFSVHRGRSGSVSTNTSMPSRSVSRSSGAMSSVVSFTGGEFDQEEPASSLEAARGSRVGTEMVDATAKMGISLVPKPVELAVQGKVKAERKSKTTNANLPFPPDSFANDLKFWQNHLLPELIEWVATKYDPFSVNANPEFRDVVANLFEQHFGAYKINDAVYSQAASAVRNWRSKFGKTALKAVDDALAAFATIQERAKHVRDELQDSSFVYEDPKNETGAYRSELMLRVFAAHLQIALKTDTWYGHPIGAMTISCAAVERALHMYKDGVLSTEGIQRKGKRSAHSFLAVPWAARAKAYLPAVEKLSTKKWSKIIAQARPFIDSAALITIDDTEGLIHISDDSDDEDPADSSNVNVA
ncbi:hypothetical protein R3P38DRAFT_3148129 [Favolaschia claudopus]|uniref:DUF6532 domain-containing protein n=1 Tax=Favolaschia claudopus TaxID=2862362 RepID=A0AAV9Z2S2_9AGAR